MDCFDCGMDYLIVGRGGLGGLGGWVGGWFGWVGGWLGWVGRDNLTVIIME